MISSSKALRGSRCPFRRSAALALACSLVLAAGPAGASPSQANDVPRIPAGAEGIRAVPVYWTPERLRAARAMPAWQTASDAATAPAEHAAATPEETVGAGGLPREGNRAQPFRLFEALAEDSAGLEALPSEEPPEAPQNVGTFGAYFTSSRLVPTNADRAVPYRAVGKLFFTDPQQGDFVCSAAVVRPRVIVTAGHCVHRGSGGSSGFFTNFLFIPAYRNGMAPFGAWDWQWVRTTTTWSNGGGTFPNAADYALIEARDQVFQGTTQRLGDVTGFFGFRTGALHPNHAHILGYPVNLDQGTRMHQVTAESAGLFALNNVRYGGDMTQGVSGGPYVQNFGLRAQGQSGGLDPTANAIVGVVSSVPVDTAQRYISASVLDGRFTQLIDQACARRQGNC